MNYKAKAQKVREKLKAAGYQVALRRTTGGSIDPVTGDETAGTTTDYTGYVLEQSYRLEVIDGTLVKRGDRRFMLALEDTTVMPQPGEDRIVVSGRVLAIVSAEPYQPGGVPLYFDVQARVA
jgi:hypothetical protein